MELGVWSVIRARHSSYGAGGAIFSTYQTALDNILRRSYARHWLASRRSAGERPERAYRDRTTHKHHADKRSRTRRRIQAMTLAPRRKDHRLCPHRYSNHLAAPPISPRRLHAVMFGHDGLRWSTSCGLKPALPQACDRYGSQPARRRDICLSEAFPVARVAEGIPRNN